MAATARSWTRAFDRGEGVRLGGFYGVVLLLHVLGFGFLIVCGGRYPTFIGLGLLAYTFGLRHAFDADHIAAIDNTTRKLLQQGKKPVGVGFFFSMGHSTIVFVIALLLALAVRTIVSSVVSDNGQLHNFGGLFGTGISGLFLIVIGVINLLTLLDIVRVYRRMRAGTYDPATLQTDLVAGGLYSRMFSWLFKFVNESWQMYPVGVLFGLGFDTATEVALLGFSAGAAAKGISFFAIISLPLLFTAGMSLMDTTDGAFMSKAYSWAFSKPIRKVFYNMTITSLSVFIALFVGVIEVIQLMSSIANAQGGVWDFINSLDFETMGFIVVGAFVLTWAGAFTYYKLARVEERWSGALGEATGPDG